MGGAAAAGRPFAMTAARRNSRRATTRPTRTGGRASVKRACPRYTSTPRAGQGAGRHRWGRAAPLQASRIARHERRAKIHLDPDPVLMPNVECVPRRRRDARPRLNHAYSTATAAHVSGSPPPRRRAPRRGATFSPRRPNASRRGDEARVCRRRRRPGCSGPTASGFTRARARMDVLEEAGRFGSVGRGWTSGAFGVVRRGDRCGALRVAAVARWPRRARGSRESGVTNTVTRPAVGAAKPSQVEDLLRGPRPEVRARGELPTHARQERAPGYYVHERMAGDHPGEGSGQVSSRASPASARRRS